MLGEDEVTVTSPVEYFASKVNYASIQSSKTEKRAEVLERDCVDYKKVEYASRFIGTITSGLLTSITNFGLFITLENMPICKMIITMLTINLVELLVKEITKYIK